MFTVKLDERQRFMYLLDTQGRRVTNVHTEVVGRAPAQIAADYSSMSNSEDVGAAAPLPAAPARRLAAARAAVGLAQQQCGHCGTRDPALARCAQCMTYYCSSLCSAEHCVVWGKSGRVECRMGLLAE